jgi:RNA polymerase sigma factor (sigma-70 family)
VKILSLSNTEEADLISGCIAGNRIVQKRLYELFASRMLILCQRYSKTTFEAEDALQEGFVKVFRAIKDFSRDCPLEMWIRRIMVNTALKQLRGQMLVVNIADTEPLEETPEEEFVISGFGYKELLGMIQSLAPRYQMIFNLYAIEGYTHKEIGEMLSISEGTSKSQYARARAILKGQLEKEQEKTTHEKVIR